MERDVGPNTIDDVLTQRRLHRRVARVRLAVGHELRGGIWEPRVRGDMREAA